MSRGAGSSERRHAALDGGADARSLPRRSRGCARGFRGPERLSPARDAAQWRHHHSPQDTRLRSRTPRAGWSSEAAVIRVTRLRRDVFCLRRPCGRRVCLRRGYFQARRRGWRDCADDSFVIETAGPGALRVHPGCRGLGARAMGLLTLFVRHTSCSLLVQENADPDVQDGSGRPGFYAVAVPRADDPTMGYLTAHVLEGADDMPAHIKAALLPVSVQIPVAGWADAASGRGRGFISGSIGTGPIGARWRRIWGEGRPRVCHSQQGGPPFMLRLQFTSTQSLAVPL